MGAHTPNKADGILSAAAELFATKPFHEVRLDDIAAAAHVGKGTVYLYWTSKEEVYLAIIRRGFKAVCERIERELPGCHGFCWDEVHVIVAALVDFAFAYPGVYRIMRMATLTPEDPELQGMRNALTDRVERVLTAGVASGDVVDACPALTTQYLLSFVRGAALYPPAGLTPELLRDHLINLLRRGLGPGAKA